jgi:hypothetical protein
MTKLRVLAIASDKDKTVLDASSLVQDRRISELAEFCCDELFASRALKNEDLSKGSLWSLWCRGREEEPRILDSALSQDPDVCILFVGSGARNDPNFADILKRILAWRSIRGPKSLSLIVFQITSLNIDELDWPSDTLFVEAVWAESNSPAPGRKEFSETQDVFCARLVQSAKRIQREPEVGIGVLLINSDGKFLLAERLRFPAAGKFGTFGGSLPHLQSPEQALVDQGGRQFGIGEGMQIGPLLACTNMISATVVHGIQNHYIDLTFLALLNGGKASPRDPLRHKPIELGGQSRIWFSIEEVYEFFKSDQLFAPVANSFQRYCSWAALGHVTEASGVSSWMGLHSGAEKWIRALHKDKLGTLTAVAADASRNQSSPVYFEDN